MSKKEFLFQHLGQYNGRQFSYLVFWDRGGSLNFLHLNFKFIRKFDCTQRHAPFFCCRQRQQHTRNRNKEGKGNFPHLPNAPSPFLSPPSHFQDKSPLSPSYPILSSFSSSSHPVSRPTKTEKNFFTLKRFFISFKNIFMKTNTSKLSENIWLGFIVSLQINSGTTVGSLAVGRAGNGEGEDIVE